MTASVALLAGDLTGQGWSWGSRAGPWFPFGFFFWLIPLLALGVLVAFFAVRRAGARGPMGGEHAGAALRILQERYARGDIQREQFEQMKRDLEQ